jgi:uncharacterized protein YPO0396
VSDQSKLTPLQAAEARRLAAEQAKANKVPQARSEEEKAARKERVTKAKDALSRSVGIKGDHVAGARAGLLIMARMSLREFVKYSIEALSTRERISLTNDMI